MGYVAIKGGSQAIEGSKAVFDFLRTRQGDDAEPLEANTIEHQLRFLHSRVISEGGVYHPQLASLAIKQAQGDTLEAAFALRAYRSTQPRLTETPLLDTAICGLPDAFHQPLRIFRRPDAGRYHRLPSAPDAYGSSRRVARNFPRHQPTMAGVNKQMVTFLIPFPR